MRCIYIINIDKGRKYYIGSAENLHARRYNHLYFLKTNKHHNRHLQNMFNKKLTFEFSVVEEVPPDIDLFEIEQRYLDKCIQDPNCCNISKLAGGGALYEITPDTIAKGIATKERLNKWGGGNEDSRKAAQKANTGAKRSEKSKKIMSVAAKKRYEDPIQAALLASNQATGRANRWEKYCQPFKLIREEDGTELGPYSRQQDVPKSVLSNVSVSKLYLGKISQVKGYALVKCAGADFQELIG
jgi:group I intron endonuclease